MYKLAATLGYANVDAMTREMTSSQITEWQAFYRLEPFGFDRVEYLLAKFMAIYVNANRAKGKRALNVEDFLMFLNRKSEDLKQQESFKKFFSKVSRKEGDKDG